MPGPLTQAGAVTEPSEYAALAMDRHLTGLWTQRSLLRDADVPYLYGKFYGASRYDSLCDGLNREISSRLTSVRRPGTSVWNVNTINPRFFYSWKMVQDSSEIVRVIDDDANGLIYDVTNNGASPLFTKTFGETQKTRFVGVNTELFFSNGIDSGKIITGPKSRKPSTKYIAGSLIYSNAPNISYGTLYMALGGIFMRISSSASTGSVITLWINQNDIPNQLANMQNVNVAFSGLTAASVLNGTTKEIEIVSSTLGIIQVLASSPSYIKTSETGSGTTGDGITSSSGSTLPNTNTFGIIIDGGQQWKSYGENNVFNWGVDPSGNSLTISSANDSRFWQQNTLISYLYSIIDENGNIQAAMNFTSGSGGVYKTGLNYPVWSSGAPSGQYDVTIDGTVLWWNLGSPGAWYSGQKYYSNPAGGISVIVDSNQNLQWCSNGGGGSAGTSQPTWATSIGSTTVDGSLTWTCFGPGSILTYRPISYAFSVESVDGTVCTSCPKIQINSGIIGKAEIGLQSPEAYLLISGSFNQDTQISKVSIWRTAQGQSSLILEDQIPADFLTGTFTYYEYGIPDTSTNGNGSLNALIPAPTAKEADPPPSNLTAPVYHLERVWGIVNNTVVWSAGPDAVTGNGNTQFPPLNYIAYPEQPIRLFPFTTNNGGIMVLTTSNIYVILGTGTQSNPFYTTIYMPGIGILNYDAVDVIGSTLYLMTSKGKVASIDPSAGYVEIGFPIGDQFNNVTTGVGSFDGFNTTVGGALYNPATATVTWHEQGSGDTAIYVSDGRYGWFRYSPVATPESGYVWSPRATVIGGCLFAQSIEVSPGISKLLIAPYGGGPILMRDSTVSTDWVFNAVGSTKAFPYPSYQTIGNITLCESGEIAEVAHIGLKSVLVGSKPTVSILFGELAATAAVPFDVLHNTAPDPPDLPPSQTIYSDRYVTMQNGVCPLCEHLQLKIDYGMQAFPDELLKHSIYGAHHSERKQQ